MTRAMEAASISGRTLGEYVVGDKIGEGGFGAVYRATQPLLDRVAVIKVLHTQLRANSSASGRFLREARLASRLDHPYAAHIYGFGAERDGTLWIAMEHVRGVTLGRYLEVHGPMPIERLVPLVERICEVVHSAHEQGIVHRDLKPANVMVLSRSGRLLPKLLDFGIAKAMFEGTRQAGAGGEDPEATLSGLEPSGELDRTAVGEPSVELDRTVGPAELEATVEDAGSAELDPTIDSGTPAPGPVPGRKTVPLEAMAGGSGSIPRAASGDEQLTQAGAVMGSPRYMAPEQWQDSASVDARADLYALGVVAYEALTGSPPFKGASLADLAAAHDAGDIPELPEPLPRGLGAFFARALARRPEDRFGDALELAAAFREAAGLRAERQPLPQLDEAVRQRFMTGAPQPLAEAVGALEAARDPRQARDAAWALARTLARYLGLLAVVARSRLGEREIAPAATAVLRRLGLEVLSEGEWVELAVGLCRGHVDRPDLHPIPELVRLLARPGGEPGEGARLFAQLDELREALADAAAGDEAIVARLTEALSLLSELLRGADFVCQYTLVVPTASGFSERWVGIRRARRTAMMTQVRAAEPGRPLLLDGDGGPVLSLYPVVQIEPPSPGAGPEVFLYAGRDGQGARLSAEPHPFVLHDPKVLDWLRAQMATTLDDRAEDASGERPPYRGLEPFTPDDAALFFGRERAVDAMVNRLRGQPLIAVVGQSGAGKSSFVQAGVIPALGPKWRAITTRPGPAPLAALAAAVTAAGLGAERLEETLTEHPEQLREILGGDAEARGPILLVIDQLEELFTLARDEDERHRFAAAVASVARTRDDPVRVVLTLRDDFLVNAEELPELRDRLSNGLQVLTTPSRAELERILVAPARRVGYEFEDPELPARMVDEVAGRPGALALLSFTAAQMWERRDRHFRQLPASAYEALGGVGGALARHAEDTLEGVSAEEARLIRETFRHLVTGEGTRAVMSRSELLEVLGGGDRARAALEHLIAARLLVASEAEHGEERIEIIHEALLREWPRLVGWRREDAEGARLRDQLRVAAHQWDERGRSPGLLWRGDALVEYRLWRSRFPGELTTTENDFAAASLAEAARGQRLRRRLVVVAFVVMVAGMLALLSLNRRAERSAALSEQRLVALYKDEARRAALDNNSERTLLYLDEARKRGATGADIDFLLARAVRQSSAELVSIDDHEKSVEKVEFSPDGALLVSASHDHTARVFKSDDGEAVHTFRHDAKVWTAHFSADGGQVLTASRDGTVRLWDTKTGELIHKVSHRGKVREAIFDRTGARFLSAGIHGEIRVWDTKTGALLHVLSGHKGPVLDIDLSPDGAHLVSASVDRALRIWSLDGDKPTSTVLSEGGHGVWWSVRYSPDGASIAAIGESPATFVFDAETRTLRHELAHPVLPWTMAFDPRGRTLLTAAQDGAVRQWDARSGRLIQTMQMPAGWATGIDFSHDGERIVTASSVGHLRLWEAGTGRLLATFKGHRDAIMAARFSPDDERIATASQDSGVKVWDAGATDFTHLWQAHPGAVSGLAFSPSGDRVASAGGDSPVRMWDVETGAKLGEFAGTGGSTFLRFSGDGARLIAGEQSHLQLLAVDGARVERSIDTSGPVIAAAFEPTGTIAAVSTDGRAAAWGAADEPVWKRELKPDLIAAAWSRDARILATATIQGEVDLWMPSTGDHLRALPTHDTRVKSIAFSSASDRVATASADRTIRVWSVATGALESTLEGHTAIVDAVSFGPRDRYIISGSLDAKVGVWDASTGSPLAMIGGHDRVVTAARIGPDGRFAVSGADDGRLAIWNISPAPVDRELFEWLLRCRVSDRMQDGKIVVGGAERAPSCTRLSRTR